MLKRSTLIASSPLLALALCRRRPAAAGSGGAVVFSRAVTDRRSQSRRSDGSKRKRRTEGGLFAARDGRLNQLTENPADTEPDFSADGRMIAFVRDGDIYSMRADGSGQRPLTSGPEVDGGRSLSPNGRYVVFERRGRRGRAARPLHGRRSPAAACTR